MRCAPFIAGMIIVIALASAWHRARSKPVHVEAHHFAAQARQLKQKVINHFKHPRPPAATPIAPPPPALRLVDNTPDDPTPLFHKIVIGRPQLDSDDAVDAALQEAQQQVTAYLTENKVVGDWQPSVEYIKDRLLRDVSQDNTTNVNSHDAAKTKEIWLDSPGRGRFKALETVQQVDGTPMYQVYLSITVGHEELAEMLGKAHHERMADRMLPLARALGCLVALFAAIGLYIRFDELTKGYYRTVLRVGATGFVAAAWLALAWPVIHLLIGG